MKKIFNVFIMVLVSCIILAPFVSIAAGLVPCSGSDCTFNDFLKLVNNLINYVFIVFAVPVAAIMFAYAGFLMVTSAGSKESREKAKSIFTNVALGLFFIGASWLIVHIILSIAGYDLNTGTWFGL